uniref:Uncharacterized protein n=1 Tax=Oryza barthii TaxID=65489 RepID=A0A0D3FSK5_9ORYZ
MAQAATTSTLPLTQAPCILNPRRIIVQPLSPSSAPSPVITIHCRHPRGCRCCRRWGGLTTHESFGVGHRRHDEGDGAARRRGRNEVGWQGAGRPGPLLALPRRKPSCRLTPCAGSPATATYLHRVGTLRPPPAFAASGPPRPPPVFVVPETHGRHLSRRTREQEGPRPPPRRPSTRARAPLSRTPETCYRLIDPPGGLEMGGSGGGGVARRRERMNGKLLE